MLTVYFDGLCPLCSREIAHYRRIDSAGRLAFVDISAPGFDAAALGLDSVRVQRHLHSCDASGRLYVGVDSFLEIWRRLPRYELLYVLASLPVFLPPLRLAYAAFARVRPWLPRGKAACHENTCARKGASP